VGGTGQRIARLGHSRYQYPRRHRVRRRDRCSQPGEEECVEHRTASAPSQVRPRRSVSNCATSSLSSRYNTVIAAVESRPAGCARLAGRHLAPPLHSVLVVRPRGMHDHNDALAQQKVCRRGRRSRSSYTRLGPDGPRSSPCPLGLGRRIGCRLMQALQSAPQARGDRLP